MENEKRKPKRIIDLILETDTGNKALEKAGYDKQTLEEMRAKEEAWLLKNKRLTGGKREVTKAELEYWEDVLKTATPKLDSVDDYVKYHLKLKPKAKNIIPHYKIEYGKAKYIVWKIATAMAESDGREFSITEHNKKAYAELTRYFTGDPKCIYDLKKGVYIWGATGCGKTFVLDVFREFVNMLMFKPRMFSRYNAAEIVDSYGDGKKGGFNSAKRGAAFIDDLGEEKDTVINYGDSTDVMANLLKARFKVFDQRGTVTHLSSNLPANKIIDRYGDRLASRFKDMFNAINLSGDDFRGK